MTHDIGVHDKQPAHQVFDVRWLRIGHVIKCLQCLLCALDFDAIGTFAWNRQGGCICW